MELIEIENQITAIEEILNTPFQLEWGDFDLFQYQSDYDSN